MHELKNFLFPFLNLRLYENIEGHLQEDNRKSDLFMLYLILLHWLVATFITSEPYNTHLLGFAGGGLLALVTLATYRLLKHSRAFRLVAAFVLMSFSAIFIQQHLGRIELHFHVFVALAFLTVYKDFLPLLFGAAFTTFHHFFFNYLQSLDSQLMGTPLVIFNYGCGYDIVVIHALFVMFETIMLLYITSMRQLSFSKILHTSQRLEYLNANLAQEVDRKTKELQNTVTALEQTNAELLAAKNKALGAIEARSNFISSVSHELRTPLNSIINFTDMVLEDYEEMFKNEETKRENKDFLGRVLKNSKHLLALINDILEFTKAEAGKLQYEFIQTDINALVHNAFANTQGLLNHSPIKAELILSETPLLATVDKRRFFQILLNLISNAIKFTNEGRITVRTYDKGDGIRVDIEDTGRGIPREKLSSIFDPFVQVTHHDSGTGLGLVIVKKLCDDMGIGLELESTVGTGTRFSLVLNKISDRKQ